MIEINLAAKGQWELQIKTLPDAPRDENKLREILKVKQKEYEKAQDGGDIESIVTDGNASVCIVFGK